MYTDNRIVESMLIKIGTVSSLSKVPDESLELDNCIINFKESVKYLGVNLDQTLSMTKQISSICRSCFLELRKIASIRKYLNKEALTTLVLTKIISQLDYCNSVYYRIPDEQLNRLQRVQNAAARLILGKKKRDHITPLLRKLHWLPVKARCQYKIATLAFHFFDGSLAPSLASDLQQYRPSRNLRSSTEKLLTAHRYNLKSAGGRSFKVAAPTIWNALPLEIRHSESLTTFKRRLKTHLFNIFLS